MSEQAVEAAPPPRRAKGSGKKILGLPMPVALGAGAGLLVLGYLWWKSRKSSASATTASTVSTATSAYNDEELASELEQFLAEQSSAATTSGSTGAGTTGTTGTSSSSTTSPTGGGGTQTTTSTTTTTGASPVKSWPAPGSLTVTPAKTSLRASWTAPGGYQGGYYYWLTNGPAEIKHGTVQGTSAAVSGLRSGAEYGFHVRAATPTSKGAARVVRLP